MPQEVLDRSVVIRRLPAGIDKSQVRDLIANLHLAGVAVSRVHLVHGEKTTQALVELDATDSSAASSSAPGSAAPADGNAGAASADGAAAESKQSDRDAVLARTQLVIAALSGADLNGQKLKAQPATEFPCMLKEFKPSAAAVGIAKGVVFAEKFASSAAKFDDEHGLSRTVGKITKSGEERVTALDQQFKVSASLKEGYSAVGNKVAEVGAATGVTAAAKSAADPASNAAASFAALPVVSSGWSFISSLANKTVAAVDSLSAEVNQLLADSSPGAAAEGKRASRAPIPDEEPVVSHSGAADNSAAAPAAAASAPIAAASAPAPAAATSVASTPAETAAGSI